jgi:hypothetical protein
VNVAVGAFVERADVTGWWGLPAMPPAALGATEPWITEWRDVGDPPRAALSIALPPGCFEGGLRCWMDGDAVRVLEGLRPRPDGEQAVAPDLGAPAARLPIALGLHIVDDGELVYPERGLAVRVNPPNGILLGLVGFAPTTLSDYVARLRPASLPARPREGAPR